MTERYGFSVYEDRSDWIVLECQDEETADLFDDFLIEALDIVCSRKFDNSLFSFFFDTSFSIKDVTDLFLKFKEIDLANS
ncbi:MAG: hypothetical protein RLZZ157_149 [Pseudomonadota bacterium]|jgi:hypothetical protein